MATDPGLCKTCLHAHRTESDRGSVFWRCELSRTDARFPKYPRLPVLTCRGYEREGGGSRPDPETRASGGED